MTAPDFNQLAAPRFAEGVRRLLGEDVQVSSVAPELAPYISLQSDRPEWQLLLSETLWSHGGARAALAANFSSLSIRAIAPARITVVTGVLIVNGQGVAQSYKLGETNGLASDSSILGAVRDQRRGVISTKLSLRAQAGDALTSLPVIPVPAGTSLFIPIKWCITELTAFAGPAALTLQGGVVNQEVSAYFWGYERALRPEEIQLD